MSSDAPVIFRRSKTKPTARARQPSPDLTENNEFEGVEDSPSTLVAKLKTKVKKERPKSRLSFGGDEEEDGEEVFKVKKSKLSLKVASGRNSAIVPPTLDQATISADESPKYDAAYLQELKASTLSARPPRASKIDPYDADMSMSMAPDDIPAKFIATEAGHDSEFLATTSIPSESSIKVAKEKRERVRKVQASGEEDFISLLVAKMDAGPLGPHPESRLMREEDELGEGDDEFAEYTSAQERIALGKKSKKIEATQRRVAMKELIADAEEEDEETMEWEQEQLRRGGHRTPEPSTAVKQVYKATPIPPSTPIPTLAPAIARLSAQLAQLTTSHTNNTISLTSLAQERSQVDDREKEMREMIEKAEAKRAWFGDFKEWADSVAGFLDEKYPLLEKLEEEQLSLLKERYEMITRRRKEDDADDLAAFYGPLASNSVPENDPFDEYGRVRPSPDDERKQRRAARVLRRQLRSAQSQQNEEEGYSTDSSLMNPDLLAYSNAMSSLTSQKKEILADVKAEEFKDPGKGRWSIWREKYLDSYVGAWGGLGVVSVWEFWVRLECVGWDCIADPRSLHAFKWYKGLYEYCRPGNSKVVEERQLGPDGDLVASMISTAIIPLICKTIDNGALDVYSQKDIRRIIDLAEEIEASIDSESSKFQLVLKSVAHAFEQAISNTEAFVTEYIIGHQSRVGFNPEAVYARKRFLNRRVKLLGNLLCWRKYSGEQFGLGLLVERLIERSIINVAEGGWDVGGEDIARKVIKMLPQELVPSSLQRFRAV